MKPINAAQIARHISKIATIGILGWTSALLTLVIALSSGYSFINPAFNSFLYYSLFLCPTILFIFFAASTLPKVLKVIGCCVLLPVSLVFLLGLLMTGPDIRTILRDRVDPSDEFICSVPLGSSRIAAYRTNGGATTNFGVDIMRQRFILPGIKHSVGERYEYGAADVELDPIDKLQLRCHICPTDDGVFLEDSIITAQ